MGGDVPFLVGGRAEAEQVDTGREGAHRGLRDAGLGTGAGHVEGVADEHAGEAELVAEHPDHGGGEQRRAIVVEALDPDRPATFSPTVIGVLRDELGFQGVLVSDALDMAGASAETGIPEAAVLALEAGVDLLCLGSATDEERYVAVHAAVCEAVASGRLPEQRVAEAAGRVRALAARPAPGPTSGQVARAFSLSDAARTWLASPAPLAVVQVDSTANLAVGSVSWGPAALGVAVPEAAVPAGAKVAVVGRAVGADHPARATARPPPRRGPRRRPRRVRLAAGRRRRRDLRRARRSSRRRCSRCSGARWSCREARYRHRRHEDRRARPRRLG